MRQIAVGTFKTTSRMREYVNDVLDSGRLSYGDYSRVLERQFALMHNSDYAVLSNSGTSSLQVALQALKELRGWQDGDEVIIPAITFVATANIVIQNNMTPILVDIDPDYYAIDMSKIEQAITLKTRAIIPVHVFGQPCDMATLRVIANVHRLAIVEDSCECMFVSQHGKRIGAWGEIGCFSTYIAHLLTTGVGGIAVTNNKVLAEKMRSLVNHGRDGVYISIDDDDNLDNGQRKEIIAKRFNFESIGHSYRITELEAALGLAQLEDIEMMIAQRQANAVYLTKLLQPLESYIQLPCVRMHTEHSWMMYPMVLRSENKDSLTAYLEAHGIETREMLPLITQPCYLGRWDARDYPIADWVNRCGFYVGIHQGLTPSDLDYIAEMLGAYFESLH